MDKLQKKAYQDDLRKNWKLVTKKFKFEKYIYMGQKQALNLSPVRLKKEWNKAPRKKEQRWAKLFYLNYFKILAKVVSGD